MATRVINNIVRDRLIADTQHLPEEDKLKKREELLCQAQYPLSRSTCYRWMKIMNFKYEPIKKSYYTDGHENKGVVTYRENY